jgi:hypothetical protein
MWALTNLMILETDKAKIVQPADDLELIELDEDVGKVDLPG